MSMSMNERLTDRYGRDAQAIGYDKDGNAFVMRWSEEHGCWGGCGFDGAAGLRGGLMFILKDEKADFIVEHSAPARLAA